MSGSKKDVLIGKLVPSMDPEDMGGGEMEVESLINGSPLLEESAAVDSDDPPAPVEEENEEEKKDGLKVNFQNFHPMR